MRATRLDEPRGAATARAKRDRPRKIAAGLFKSLIERLEDERRWVILDLGAVHARTLSLLDGKRCLLDVADLAGDLSTVLRRVEPEQAPEEPMLPPAARDELADIVLCWDLLNYLDTRAIEKLMAEIAKRCRAGALVHALVVYSEHVMHDTPGQFVPFDAGTLIDVAAAAPDRPAPRYSTEVLSEAMPDFSVERVRLLGNGMQEYLFKARPVREALDAAPEYAAM